MNLRMLIGSLLVALTGSLSVDTRWVGEEVPVVEDHADHGDAIDVADLWLQESAPKS